MKPVSDQLFSFTGKGTPTTSHERCSASELGLRESWLRDAIFKNPELVIGPCRAAGLTDDEWYSWLREYKVEQLKATAVQIFRTKVSRVSRQCEVEYDA